MDRPTDEHLLSEHLAGRSDAFELLVRRHSPELHRFALRFTNSSLAADDVVQETFIKVYQSAETFDTDRRFKPWLFTIAANKARDWIRQRSRRSELPLDAQIEKDGEAGSRSFLDLMSADDDDDAREVELEDQRRNVRVILEAMPEMLREVLILAYYHKLPYRDIAEVLGVPLGTVKSRLHSAVGHFGVAYRQALAAKQDYGRKSQEL